MRVFTLWKTMVLVGLVALAGCAATEKREAGPEPGARAAVSEDHAAGRAIYDANCGSCHRLGDYDSEGRGNLRRKQEEIDAGLLGRHHGGSLSPADAANLRAFISTQ